MGKRGHNWKARQVVETLIDDSPTKKIKLDLNIKGNYDQSNEVVLPSNKRKTKIKKKGDNNIKILSKKQRKRLEKIVERKSKKLERADLLEKLSKVQATDEELRQLTSTASAQTKGLKKLYIEEEKNRVDLTEVGINRPKINSIRGSRKILPGVTLKPKYNRNDPNIVCSESDDSDEEDDDDDLKDEHGDLKDEHGDLKDDHGDLKEDDDDGDLEEKPNVEKDVIELNDNSKSRKTEEIVEDLNKESNVSTNKGNGVSTKDVPTENKVETKDVERKPAVFVEVYRTEEIQTARLKLPILAEEQQIMEIINENDIVIIAGETGSGKTTQVPQFLYEAGYATSKMIGVTEPRRVAAISMSNRVAEEMNLTSKEISYLIRFEGNVAESTKIKFMTDGVLLKEIKNDFLLTRYSVIILDEAHERSVYTDILIGFLSRVVPMRKKRGEPLKLIVMSATLRLSDFTENSRLFKKAPPVVNVEARQFPVTVHFNRKTPENYLLEALRKTVKIHNTLPEGGVLIFVTGQKEVNFLVRKLRQMFPLKNKERMVEISKELNERRKGETPDVKRKKKRVKIIPDINLDDYSLPGDNEIDSENSDVSDLDDDLLAEGPSGKNEPLWVLPLFSLLPSRKQTRVFEKPPEGCRLCVVSTNVAETSLTIPNVKYVVDTGKTKTKLYDKVTGVTSYAVTWTSKASANQRAGRAGRTAPGHCYRLYSSAVFNDVFQEFQVPEIQLKPVDDLFLQMKCMHIDKIVNFPFPTAPDLLQLKTAERRLEILGLIENSKVTDLGKTVAKFPILPRFGKMLALSHQFDLLPYTICLVAALSVQEVLIETEKDENVRLIRKKWAKSGNFLKLGDPMVLLTAVGGAEYANSQGKLEKFCTENSLRQKAIIEIRKLRVQLTNEVNLNIPELNASVDPTLRPPTDTEAKLLRQILLCGMPDKIARKIDLSELNPEDRRKFKFAYHTENMEDPIFIHRNSVLKKNLPEFVVYQEIYETNKLYMRGITEIEPEWLALYAPKICNLSEPLQDPEPQFDENTGKVRCTVNGTFGKRAFPLPNVLVNFPDKPDVYKWFCKFFLEGKIAKPLEKYAKNLLHPAVTIAKPWAKLQPRVVKILKTVATHRCKTRDDLLQLWESDPKFLLDDYLLWLPESLHPEVVLVWPPVN